MTPELPCCFQGTANQVKDACLCDADCPCDCVACVCPTEDRR